MRDRGAGRLLIFLAAVLGPLAFVALAGPGWPIALFGTTAPSPDGPAPAGIDGPWDAVQWQLVAEPFPAADPAPARIDALVAGPGRVVGWGRVPAPGRNQFNEMGAVFVSADGRRWRSVPLDDGVGPLDTSEPFRVAIGPAAMLAYGGVCCSVEEQAIWLSEDGEEWRRQRLDGDVDGTTRFASIAAAAEGWVAVGGAGDQAAIWHSADGVTWDAVDAAAAGLGRGQVTDVATVDGAFVAVGTLDDAAGTHDGAVWRSDDGIDWERVAKDDPSLTGPDETELWRIVSFTGGLFLTGNFGSHEDRVECEELLGAVASLGERPPTTALSCGWGREHHWLSADGTAWQRLPPLDPLPGQPRPPGVRPLEFRLLAAAGPGLANFAEDLREPEGDTGLWTSADGASWQPVNAAGQRLPNAGAAGFAVLGTTLIGVADSGEAGGWKPVIWNGRVALP